MAVYLGAIVHAVTIEPDWNDLPRREGDIEVHWPVADFSHRELQENSLKVALAGPAAEMIHRGERFHPARVAEWAGDLQTAWKLAESIVREERARLRYLEHATAQIYHFLAQDAVWNALAAIVDELLAHETLEGEQVHDIMRRWLG